MTFRNKRTPSKYIYYALYFYFSGLSLRKASNRLSSCLIKPNHVSIWNWIQKYKLWKISSTKRKVEEFIIDETLIKIGLELVWIWISIDIKSKEILEFSISRERNMLIAERVLSKNIDNYDKHPPSVSSNCSGTWYPHQACQFLKLQHHIHSSFEKSLIDGEQCNMLRTELQKALMTISFLASKEKRNVN